MSNSRFVQCDSSRFDKAALWAHYRGMNDDYDDSHGAWHAQVEEQQRLADEERARFLAAHPGYEQCPKHPERPVVDSSVCTLRFCAECIERHKQDYADQRSEPRYDDHRMAGGILYTRTSAGWTPNEQPKGLRDK